MVEKTVESTRELYSLLQESGDFEPVHEPVCNILCFRYVPPHAGELDRKTLSDLQKRVRQKMVQRGKYYTTGMVLDGEYVLRVTVINPRTDVEHFEGLLEEIRELARE